MQPTSVQLPNAQRKINPLLGKIGHKVQGMTRSRTADPQWIGKRSGRAGKYRQCPSALDRHRAAPIAPQQAASPASAEDESDVSALIARLTAEVNQVACEKTRSIQQITNQMKMLALNALIESSRAGAQGAGFAVVAQEVRNVGQQVETIARELESQLTNRTGNLMSSISRMTDRSRGERMVDLSLNAIELIDRNLYERTCDVRWWATNSAVVDCAATPDAAAVAHVSERLAVILGAYTVYLDLWLCDLDGNVIANGRADRFNVVGQNVASTKWFREARGLRSGDDYVAGDVESQPLARQCPGRDLLRQRPRRRQGQWPRRPACWRSISTGSRRPAPSSQGVRVGAADKARVLLVDSSFRVIASSDGQGILSERVPLNVNGQRGGFYQDRSGGLVAFHATPGYETYKGLGWYGVITTRGRLTLSSPSGRRSRQSPWRRRPRRPSPRNRISGAGRIRSGAARRRS